MKKSEALPFVPQDSFAGS